MLYMLKGYKYRIYPTQSQKALMSKHFGCARWIYNYGLSEKTRAYKDGKKLTCIDLINRLKNLKIIKNTSWLGEVNSQTLQMSLRNLDNAYTNFFRKKKDFPRFKSKADNHQHFQCCQHSQIDWGNKLIKIIKFKEGIKIILHRKFEGKIKTVTISKNPANRYFASVLVDDGEPLPEKSPVKNAVGIDVGLKHFATLSTGRKFENPRFLKGKLTRLGYLQRRFARTVKGGKNREKMRLKIARLHEHIGNCRKDFLHKVTRELVNDNQVDTYCVETLNVKGMMANRKLARATQDASWSSFVNFLSYKAEWAGKNVLKVGRFEPSTKTCNACGRIKPMPLAERVYHCTCGYIEDRDVNAAKNIRQFALLTSGKDVACESVEPTRVKSRKVKTLAPSKASEGEEAETSGREAGNLRIYSGE